jgi:hypothetical protein
MGEQPIRNEEETGAFDAEGPAENVPATEEISPANRVRAELAGQDPNIPKKRGFPKIQITSVAVYLGLLLAISSLYQLNQMNDDQIQYDSLTEDITDLELVRTTLRTYEQRFNALYYELLTLDYEFYLAENDTEEYYNEIVIEKLIGISGRYTTLQNKFYLEFFQSSEAMVAGGGTVGEGEYMYDLGAEFSWLFEEKIEGKVVRYVWDVEADDFYYEQEVTNASIVTVEYCKTAVQENWDFFLNYTTYDAVNLANRSRFMYNRTTEALTTSLPGVINIRFNRDPFNAIVNAKTADAQRYEAHINHLSNNLAANGIAVLLISFLVEFTDQDRIVKVLYLILATFLGLYSLIGPSALAALFS